VPSNTILGTDRTGTKNAKTMWREAQELIGDGGLVVDVADPSSK
jgi:hypothetical protein